MSATAKVLCDGQSAVFHRRLELVSVKALSCCYYRHKSVDPELLGFRCLDRVCTGAKRNVGRGKPLLYVELLGQEHSTDGIDGDIYIFNLGNGAIVHPLQPVGVSYGEQVHPLGSGRLVIVVHP